MSAAADNVTSITKASEAPHVYQAIRAVMGDLSKEGIGKDRTNEQQRFKFRGIDDVYNALSATMTRHGLMMVPTVESHVQVERVTANGKPIFYSTARVRYTFISAEDGSTHDAVTYGEAMDSADKSTNKAMSAAFKYCAMQVFCIPTEGDNDADATTHDVSAIMPASAFDALRKKAEASGSDVEKWEAYVEKCYPQGVPMAAYDRIDQDIERAAAARAKAADQAVKETPDASA